MKTAQLKDVTMRQNRAKKILLVGGGSGGHVLPLLPVAQQLMNVDKNLELQVWSDKKTYQMAKDLFRPYNKIIVKRVLAGKIRRYSHLKWWQHLQISILWPNIKDIFYILACFIQSFWKLVFWRPNIIFLKGGYVSLPVGLMARLLGIKIIIHDSDAVPGLANAVLAKFANKIATGFPIDNYPTYNKKKLVYTGIPIKNTFTPVNQKERNEIKRRLGLPAHKALIVAVGGGLGSKLINTSVVSLADSLPDNIIVLASGSIDYDRVLEESKNLSNVILKPFFHDIDLYILASDLVICRAGATTIAELTSSRKPAIIIPSSKLPNNHQVRNAQSLAKSGVADVITESELENDSTVLCKHVSKTLRQLSDNSTAINQRLDEFHLLAKPDAAKKISELILSEAKR